jgi:predicted membrane-bound mannosyltransferase
MHGPLLFHLNALVYLLVGDSDATSRYAPAAFGILIVWLPYLLRGSRFLGRWGALATGALLLISPTILYQSRYIRHDVYTVAGVLLMFICLVRFIDTPERKWVITFFATTALMLANHEIIFAQLLLFGLFLYGSVMFDRARHWWHDQRDLVYGLIGLHIFAAVALAGLYLFMPREYMDRLLAIPWDSRGADSLPPTRENQVNYYQDMVTNWLVIGGLLIGVLFIAGLVYLLRSYKRVSETGEGWLDDSVERSPGRALNALIADGRTLAIGVGVFLFIFIGLFTTLFTNWYGILSSTIATDGTLLYWLGQHDVQRGSQPWFYFLVMLPQYEFLPITVGAGLALLASWRGIRGLITAVVEDERIFFRLFLAFWFFGILAILSWAGEKMPWLIVHIVLPGTILAGAAIGRMIERGIEMARENRISVTEHVIFGGLLIAAVGWFLLAARLTIGTFNGDCPNGQDNCRTVPDRDLSNWWLLAIPPVAWLALLAFGGIRRGWKQTALVGMAAVVVVLAVIQIRVGWRLSYENPDVVTEMMVYTQTSPQMKRAVLEANALSRELSGESDGVILWDNGADGLSWPLWWYFRNNPNARTFSGTLPSDTDAAVILIMTSRSTQPQNAQVLSNYSGADYPFRWHFPEELYRNFAIAPELEPWRSAWQDEENPHGFLDVVKSIFESAAVAFTADGQQELFRMVVYRDLDDVIDSVEFQVFVRNDALPAFNQIRY